MKNGKKFLCALLSILLVASLFTGCSQQGSQSESPASQGGSQTASETDPNKEPVVLKLWGGVPEERGPADVCAKFNEEFKDKGISVSTSALSTMNRATSSSTRRCFRARTSICSSPTACPTMSSAWNRAWRST